ncbi:DUF1045 domain-containing protein [Polymorphum gilvum]|uniref:Phosphonate metabolism protein n=1 Tax=Polymorphum gilvum (strain LMG 25793 / CGMCC 1.9160 / SL003B-26A1) TaxID=991905 RepID=F2J2Y7_POLGS|nr:DUF1045 domain-containing protein [Polymorphum gilvum]ADZ68857.1 Phosphonate metabolism protein [Polymorphum gilvum SL003B-26A1]
MRYALYYTAPHDDGLTRSGAAWLGRDAVSGVALPLPPIHGLTADRVAELTAEPRRYGFHATLKPPFALAEGSTEAQLRQAFASFAARTAPFEIPGLAVSRLGSFLALTPVASAPALDALAAGCVRAFEPFRAPLSDADIARRRASGLSPRQDDYLRAWGYPYVFEDFRFHMTLSGRLEDPGEAAVLHVAADRHFAALTGRPRTIDSLGLFVEPERGAPFRVLEILSLTGSADAPVDSNA